MPAPVGRRLAWLVRLVRLVRVVGPARLVRVCRSVGLGLACLALAGAAGAAPTAAGTAPATAPGWRWPLDPQPTVLARFEAPAGPFAAGHRGVDLAASVGQRVLAAGPGRVAFSGTVAGKPVVSIDHAGGLRTTYEPVLGEVSARDRVAAGEPVGRVAGTPGHCLPVTCLHWGLRTGPGLTSYQDPLSLLGVLPVRLLPVWDVPAADPGPPPWSPLPGGPRVGQTSAGTGRSLVVPDRGPLMAGQR